MTEQNSVMWHISKLHQRHDDLMKLTLDTPIEELRKDFENYDNEKSWLGSEIVDRFNRERQFRQAVFNTVDQLESNEKKIRFLKAIISANAKDFWLKNLIQSLQNMVASLEQSNE